MHSPCERILIITDGGYILTKLMNLALGEFIGFETAEIINGRLFKKRISGHKGSLWQSFPHGFHRTLVRLAERQMLVNHVLEHKQHVTL